MASKAPKSKAEVWNRFFHKIFRKKQPHQQLRLRRLATER